MACLQEGGDTVACTECIAFGKKVVCIVGATLVLVAAFDMVNKVFVIASGGSVRCSLSSAVAVLCVGRELCLSR